MSGRRDKNSKKLADISTSTAGVSINISFRFNKTYGQPFFILFKANMTSMTNLKAKYSVESSISKYISCSLSSYLQTAYQVLSCILSVKTVLFIVLWLDVNRWRLYHQQKMARLFIFQNSNELTISIFSLEFFPNI